MNLNRLLKIILLKIEEQVFAFLQKISKKEIIYFYELFLVTEIKIKKN